MSTSTAPLPLDIKLMRLATRCLIGVLAVLVIGAMGHWILNHPVWTVRAMVVVGDVDPAAVLRALQDGWPASTSAGALPQPAAVAAGSVQGDEPPVHLLGQVVGIQVQSGKTDSRRRFLGR